LEKCRTVGKFNPPMPDHSFAYLFERFPSFVQTFVYREAVEMVRQGMAPLLVSIRRPDDPPEVAASLRADVLYLPESETLRAAIEIPSRVRKRLAPGDRTRDLNRIYEALWLGPKLREHGVRHVHAHFGGVAARTAWWVKELGFASYSFTGHANDIFCETDFPVSNARLVRDARFIVTETDYARRWMAERYPRAARKVFRVFNGIDDDFPPRAPASGVPLILSVGRSVEKKGFRYLIDACGRLRAQGLAFECRIVGGGPLEADLQAQIKAAQLGDVVRLLGPRSQGEVRVLLAAAQIFVLACVPDSEGGSDNLPTVIMEAMRCGVPVVSTHLAGVPEMIADGVEGFLVAPRDAAALAQRLAALLRDPALAGQCGARGRESAREKFSIANTTRVLKHLLAERALVNPPAAARRFDPDLPCATAWSRLRRLLR
jgi:glycosyltransferase involved in cell wall biosynthesis